MRKQKTVILGVIFLLLTSIFAMSNDGANEPKVEKKEISSEVSQVDNPNTTEETKSSKTVKDRLGVDTGMTKDQLMKFRNEFNHKASQLGIPAYTDNYNSCFKWKMNLNSYDELKDIGLDFKNYGAPNRAKSHLENAIYSSAVLVGEIYDRIYVDNQKFYKSIYRINVIEVLRGKKLIKDEFSNKISVLSKNGKDFSSSDATEMKIGEKRLFFFKYRIDDEDKFVSRARSERLIKGDILYSNSGNIIIGDLQTEIDKIKKIIKINDSDNFYKRIYKVEEEK